MIISCPACNTRYTVEPGLFAGGRRKTRCFNCGNVWAPGATIQAAQPTMAPPSAPAPLPAAPPPPQVAPVAVPEPVAIPLAVAPAPEPPPPPPEPVAPEPSEPVAPDPEPPAPEPHEPEPEPESQPAGPVRASDQPSEQLSDEELNELLGGQDDPDPVVSMMGDTPADDADDTDAFDPENLPDPEPLPSSLIPEYEEDGNNRGSGGGLGRLIAMIVGLLVIASLAGFIFLRGMIVEIVPSLAGVYDMVGLGPALGDGLDIRQVKSSRSVNNGVDILDVSGLIANVATEAKTVPSIKVSLFDASNAEVLSVVTSPANSTVKGSDRTRFRALLKNPPPTARRLEVTFTTDPVTPGATAPIAPAAAAPAAAAPAPMKQPAAPTNPAAPAAPMVAPPPPPPAGGG